MHWTISFKKLYVFFVLGLLWILLTALTKSANTLAHNELANAIIVDLLFGVPLVYFLFIRKTVVPNTTVIPIMIVGLMIGSYFLPESQQTYLNLFKKSILPILEISILGYVLFKMNERIKSFNQQLDMPLDFYEKIKAVCQENFPRKLAYIVANEIAIIYYGLISWRRPVLQSNEFSYHKKSGIYGVAGILIFSIIVETFVFHLLLNLLSPILAWILTALSIYTLMQVFGIMKSLSRRPIQISAHELTLRYGILAKTEIALSEITDVQAGNLLKIPEDVKTLSPFAIFESPNIIVSVRHAQLLTGLLGGEKYFTKLAIYVDEPTEFMQFINQERE